MRGWWRGHLNCKVHSGGATDGASKVRESRGLHRTTDNANSWYTSQLSKGGWMVGGWRMPGLSFLFFHLTITGTIHLWLTSIDKLSVGLILVSMIVKMASRWIVQQHRQLWRGFFRLQQHFNHWHFCKTLILEVESNSELTTLELAVRKVMQRERERVTCTMFGPSLLC